MGNQQLSLRTILITPLGIPAGGDQVNDKIAKDYSDETVLERNLQVMHDRDVDSLELDSARSWSTAPAPSRVELRLAASPVCCRPATAGNQAARSSPASLRRMLAARRRRRHNASQHKINPTARRSNGI